MTEAKSTIGTKGIHSNRWKNGEHDEKNTDFLDDIDAVTSVSILKDGDELYGNTRYVAAMIQRRTGGEGHRNGVRPKLASRVDSMDDYSVIFLGYPIWYNGRVFLLGGI